VLDGDPVPPWKGAQQPPPHFLAHVYYGQMAGWIKMPLGTEVGLAQATLCYMGTQLPPTERGTAAPPHFSAHVYCGQTAAWIMIPLGKEVGLGPGDTVLDRDPAPPQKGVDHLSNR